MATTKITEKTETTDVKSDLDFLVTQTEEVDGSNVVSLRRVPRSSIINDVQNTHRYTTRWNQTLATMDRLNDAKRITTNITNFAHRGSVNENYDNPFDEIYPWSGRKLCNIDMDAYRALEAGDSLTDCVKAWEGDADFSYTDDCGVWVYTPEFYGKAWDETESETTYRYFDVTDKKFGSYTHYKERVEGRWHGRKVTLTIDGVEKPCLLPTVGIPTVKIAMSTLHTYAKNWGATLDNIYSIDASTLLMIVEFATMNSQMAIGNGISDMYSQSGYLIKADSTDSTVVKVKKSVASRCIPHAIMEIGTSDGGAQVGTYIVQSSEDDPDDETLLNVTLDRATTVTVSNFWSIHGMETVADEEIGSKSGYIGTNGRCNAYYRGQVLFGNMWFYILGAYENHLDHHIYIAEDENAADNYDAFNAAVHIDTGLELPTSGGYCGKLGELDSSGKMNIPPFCTEISGSSSAPVGDYFYNGVYTYDTALFRGGAVTEGSNDGAFCGAWGSPAWRSYWDSAARPALKTP